uniref:Helicase ATP-binding domain-containing protein n=1 Tax=Coffea canephora TaxID=49390 RepID=I6M4G9_COFCA|nr:hypothetical protein 111O18.20 [Coffea canephora]
MVAENGVKDEPQADSPTSVLEDEDACKEKNCVKMEGELLLDAKYGDSSLITETMAAEEEKLLEQRAKANSNEPDEVPVLNDIQFTKLDELLTQTQLYTEFLLENMDDISKVGPEKSVDSMISVCLVVVSAESVVFVLCNQKGLEGDEQTTKEKKKGRGSKRKAASNYNNSKAKRAVAAMLTRSKEGVSLEDSNLTEEERNEKEQAELVPLLTGGKLKPYQLKGVKWLISLWQNGLNGILADQMGLGKTIQTIAFLAHLKGNGLDGPYLIIAPLSTLSNWLNEINRFAPSLNAIIYHGYGKERDEIRRKYMPNTIGPKFPIVVTSYEVAMKDARKHLRHYQWKYMVVDEGHRLKNSQCKLVKELKLLRVENRLLLTGTPLQNNLTELWSLLNFILPDIFNSDQEFESWFDLSGKGSNEALREELEEKRRTQVVAKLHSILRPFLLRRLKSDVEQMLPRKKEIILYATMTDHQKNFTDHLLNKTLEDHLREKAASGRGMKGRLNNLMIQLRKNCNHPDLLESAFDDFFPPVDQVVEQCGKFRLLDRLVGKLFARQHKVLIFSQWTKILDIIDYYFAEKGFEVCRIDGGVKLEERRRQNPQMDLQAMDRCHRIGQTKPVHVYRLATAQSVEGRMLKRAFSKLKLEHVVIGKGQFKQERTKPNSMEAVEEEDLLALLRDEGTAEEKWIQTDISEDDLERVLDRSDLVAVSSEQDGKTGSDSTVLPLKGPGWEVVIPTAPGGVLSTLNS